MLTRDLVRFGALCGALVTIGGFVAVAAPPTAKIVFGAVPPLASRDQVAQLANQMQAISKNIQQMQAHQDASDKVLNLTLLQELLRELDVAVKDMNAHPSETTRTAVRNLQDQIDLTRKQLGLPTSR